MVSALKKLMEVVSSGIGSVAGSMLAPWWNSKEGATRIQSDAAVNLPHIREEAMEEAQVLATKGVTETGKVEFGDSIRRRTEFQERKRHANIISVVKRAAQQLEDMKAPELEPDHDWSARYFGDVQDVSSEEMQALWGEVLANEVLQPGRTSVRTLGILKNLDSTTARLFLRLCSLAVYLTGEDEKIFDARVPSLGKNAAQNSLDPYGITFDTLNRLNEHGLVISDYDSYLTYRVIDPSMDTHGIELYHQGSRWDWIIEDDDVKELSVKLRGIALTIAGRELSGVVSPEPVPQYTDALKSYLHRNHRVRMKPIDDDVTITPTQIR